MSREKRFHELIEQQNREEKDRVWAKIQQKEKERLSAVQKEPKDEPVISKATSFPWRKWTAIAATSLAVFALGTFAAVKFLPFGDSTTNSGDGDGGRYFTNQSYEIIDTQKTIKDYAQEIGKDLLYFDWYAETDYVENQAWQLKDTQEIICFQEEITDINTGCVVCIFVTAEDVKLDAFLEDENTQHITQLDDVTVNWRMQDDKALLNFEYEDYRYYLRVEEPIDENHILSLVKELLP